MKKIHILQMPDLMQALNEFCPIMNMTESDFHTSFDDKLQIVPEHANAADLIMVFQSNSRGQARISNAEVNNFLH